MRGPGPDVMATLLSILLVIVPNCLASAPPAPPSVPQCYIRCGEENDCVDIHCSWDPKPDPELDPETNYSLHWEPAISEEGHVINGISSDGIIQRKHFKHGELRVWVQAKNQHSSATSQDARFNTADITQPLPPKVSLVTHEESLEISWNSTCNEQQFSWGHCDVQHRIEGDQVWLQDTDVFHGSYTVDILQPGTVYEFQVRCSCHTGLTSDWSAIYRIRSTETDGKLDVWRDCGISHTISDCVVSWKKLPVSQAHGLILGYKVGLSYNNNASESVTVTPVQPTGRVACEEMQCPFTFPVKDALSVSVSAYNTRGATVPSYLAMPIPGKEKNEQAIRLVMTEEKLTVSWDLPSQLSDHLQGYVVQCKQASRPPGHGFDWIKRDNQTFQLLQLSPGQEYEGFLYKVPNARNSHIFRHMKHQMNGSLSWNCIPVFEPNPQISVLEVVEIQPWALNSSSEETSDPDGFTRPVVGDGGSKTDCQDDQRKEDVAEECHGTDHRYGREEYTKMDDSDKERDREENGEDVWSSSEEEQPESGYEKHFMPTALEVLEV
ncbi:Interleukin-6 receptor subunit beta [Liparis tanakae]|uniref:Interleukin-6 receptor subunit beta n=1 Tax=Liparis tanakae TaxID=230148 RepID=A0A4Z2IRT3_9TELE|nr:Interleukin-6 receptor subunit beta [Liparis tanakae]